MIITALIKLVIGTAVALVVAPATVYGVVKGYRLYQYIGIEWIHLSSTDAASFAMFSGLLFIMLFLLVVIVALESFEAKGN